MDAQRLRVFAHVAKLGSFSRAAVMLGTTQSAVSKQVSDLERELDARLFDRTGRGALVTELGRVLLPKAESLIEALDSLPAELRSARTTPAGTVHLGVLPSVSRPLVQRVFERMRARHPGVRLHVMEGVTGQLDEWLAQGRVDIAIVNRFRRSRDRTVEPLFAPALYLVGAPANVIAKGESIQFARLAGLPLILPSLPHGLRVVVEETASKRHIRLAIAMELDSLTLIKDIVAGGDCFTVAARHAVVREIMRRKLRAVRIVRPQLQQLIVLATSTTRPQTLAARTVLDVVRQLSHNLIATGMWSDDAQ